MTDNKLSKYNYIGKYVYSKFFGDHLEILAVLDDGYFIFTKSKDTSRRQLKSQVPLKHFIDNNLVSDTL